MNIKRAFLTAVASLVLPGYAMAQTAVSFDTSLLLLPEGFTYTQTVTATLTCNTGNPLQQSFEIGPTTEDKVVFVVDNFDPVEFISCTISINPASGFISLGAVANGTTLAGGACVYAATPVLDESVALTPEGGLNTCVFQMAPEPFEFTITKEWEVISDNGNEVPLEANVDWTCYNVVTGPGSSALYTLTGDVDLFGSTDSETIGGVIGYHPSPAGNTYCTAHEDVVDSAVESEGCVGNYPLTIADNTNGCTITNTVFFEGIPTLSQYGLAIMALLMLGVGFVGFRRFV
jgi:hypothetical protein